MPLRVSWKVLLQCRPLSSRELGQYARLPFFTHYEGAGFPLVAILRHQPVFQLEEWVVGFETTSETCRLRFFLGLGEQAGKLGEMASSQRERDSMTRRDELKRADKTTGSDVDKEELRTAHRNWEGRQSPHPSLANGLEASLFNRFRIAEELPISKCNADWLTK